MTGRIRIPAILLLVVCLTPFTAQRAAAQIGGDRIRRPLDRPTVTPYLSLAGNRNRASSVINYYGTVRPQQQSYQQTRDLNRNLREFEREVRSPTENSNRRLRRPMLSGTTGHRTGFMTIGRGGGSGQGSSGGGGDDEGGSGATGRSAGFGSGPGFSGAQYSAGRFGSQN